MLVLGGLLLLLYFLYSFSNTIANPNLPVIKTNLIGRANQPANHVATFVAIIITPVEPCICREYLRRYEGYHSDFLAYFVPSRYHPIWGQLVFESFYGNFGVSKVFVPFLGFTTLLLAVFGAIRQFPKARFWILATVYTWS